MGNNLPIKKDSIVDKIKKWFKGVFLRSEYTSIQTISDESNINDENIIKNDNAKAFVYNMKSELADKSFSKLSNEIALNKKRDDEIEKILKNPAILYELPLDKLEALKNIVKEQENKYMKKLDKLKNETK